MFSATMTSKGQITIPKQMRVELGLVAEAWCVLRRTYGFDAREITQVLADVVSTDEIVVENPAVVAPALDAAAAGADFADALIAETARHAGCEHTVTFDRRAAKLDGMQLLS